jgi:hypothetical protein
LKICFGIFFILVYLIFWYTCKQASIITFISTHPLGKWYRISGCLKVIDLFTVFFFITWRKKIIHSVFENRLSKLLARKLQNQNIYIDSIEKIWQKSLVRINFHWPWSTAKVDDCSLMLIVANCDLIIQINVYCSNIVLII